VEALPLTERVLAYMARQRAWLERELRAAEDILAQPEQLISLEQSLESARNAERELEELEREQRGLLTEWQRENIEPAARQPVLEQAAEIAALAATLGAARSKVAQAIAHAQGVIVREQQGLRAGRARMRRYAPAEDESGQHLDLTQSSPPRDAMEEGP
jgi:hypothetical protein